MRLFVIAMLVMTLASSVLFALESPTLRAAVPWIVSAAICICAFAAHMEVIELEKARAYERLVLAESARRTKA